MAGCLLVRCQGYDFKIIRAYARIIRENVSRILYGLLMYSTLFLPTLTNRKTWFTNCPNKYDKQEWKQYEPAQGGQFTQNNILS